MESESHQPIENSKKRPSSITFLLVGLVLLVTGAGFMLSFVPLLECPSCQGQPRGFVLKNGTKIKVAGLVDDDEALPYVFYKSEDGSRRRVARADISGPWGCDRCGTRNRVSVFNRYVR
jgi:hypothetical protein